jgi:hypothetical protein
LKDGEAAAPAEEEACEDGADEAAMERHPPMPDGDDLQGMVQIITIVGKLVKEQVAQAGADNEAEGQIEDEVLKSTALKPQPPGSLLPAREEVSGEESEDVHEPVPAELKGADLYDVGVDMGKGNHGPAFVRLLVNGCCPHQGAATQSCTRITGRGGRQPEG